jgi:integrase
MDYGGGKRRALMESCQFGLDHAPSPAILVAYRHGLRASELVTLRWDDVDLATGRLHVRRAKSGDASVHPISARESRALRKLLREAPTSPYVFISERHAPLSVAGYQRMVARAGVAAKFTFLVHSHMLRHACGFKLANDGHDTRAVTQKARMDYGGGKRRALMESCQFGLDHAPSQVHRDPPRLVLGE